MKVLHVGIKNWPFDSAFEQKDARGGGSNKYCDMLLHAFPDEVESHIITQLAPNQTKRELQGNFRIYRIRTIGGRAFRQILANFISLVIAFHVIRKTKIDLLHGHMLVGIVGAFLLGKIFRLPVVGTPYSVVTTEFKFPVNKIANALERFFYTRVSRIVFETEENLLEARRRLKARFQNSTVIVTGIRCPDLSEKRLGKTERINIFFIGRIVNIKAIDNLVNGIAELGKEYRARVHLDIVGEGEEFDSICKIIEESDLRDVVRMHGFVLDPTPIFLNADIFILPSHMEGLSIALLEAMSYEIACIINNFGVPFDDSTVYKLQNNEAVTIARAIRNFVDDPTLIRKYGSRARKEILNNFSIETFAKNYLMMYETALHEHVDHTENIPLARESKECRLYS